MSLEMVVWLVQSSTTASHTNDYFLTPTVQVQRWNFINYSKQIHAFFLATPDNDSENKDDPGRPKNAERSWQRIPAVSRTSSHFVQDMVSTLVGGWATPLKDMSESQLGWWQKPNISGKIKLMATKPPTRTVSDHFPKMKFSHIFPFFSRYGGFRK